MCNCPSGYFDAGTIIDANGMIADWSCNGDSSIEKLWIPNTVTTVGSNAFSKCVNLREIAFEEGDARQLSIGVMSFAGCTSLARLVLPGRIASLGKGCFRDCAVLQSIEFGECEFLLNVSDHLFDNCIGEMTLKESVSKAVENSREVIERRRREMNANAKREKRRSKEKRKGKTIEEMRPELDEGSARELSDAWAEMTKWAGIGEAEEEFVLRRKNRDYWLRCGWSEGTLVVAMVRPWTAQWDYVQLYRGMFGLGDYGNGFYSGGLRKKVVKLLLDEIIRRNEWKQANPRALAEMEAEIKESMEKAVSEGGELPLWFAEYRWLRNRMASIGEGDMRLYVKGVNQLWGAPIHCEWAISDMRNRKRT